MPPLALHRYSTPLGTMAALWSRQGLCLLEFEQGTKGLEREWRAVVRHAGAEPQPCEDARSRALGEQLAAYFDGALTGFDLPLDLVGTPFQHQVWQALLRIPSGQTRSYAEQANSIGRPAAVRAVAAANGANKIALVVPCHRVIGSNGSLTGYGGGMPRKQWLLALERGEREQPVPAVAG